jgi:(1->4)-alpha-D-glucan 1-alpha-D-glucosylmutase
MGPPNGRSATTYRVQLHSGFGFADAAAVVPYLARLGVSHLYCSPYLQAARGSSHGYDVVDPHRLNEELGGEQAYEVLATALHSHGMGQVLDIVPNHMAVAGESNPWWWDVLEDGPSSRYAKYFDIDWQGPDEIDAATVLAPILGDHYGRVVDAFEIKIVRDGGSFIVRYFDHDLPLSPRTFGEILEPAAARMASATLLQLALDFGSLPHARFAGPVASLERHARKLDLRERFDVGCLQDPSWSREIETELVALNGDPDRLDALLRRQNYRLAFWRTASEELDYRRFFNIESLVGLRMEDEEVFADTHRLVLRLVADGRVDGLRVDHIDGLRDPGTYLQRLAESTGGVYTVVEKILGRSEDLPAEWPAHGTTGYEFLTRVNDLFVASANEEAVTDCYRQFTGEDDTFATVVHAAKRQVLARELASEVERLVRLLVRVCDGHRRHRDRTRREIREALTEMLSAFPVYRGYAQPGRPVSRADRTSVEQAAREAAARRPDIDEEMISFLGELLLLQHGGSPETEFALRFAQVSAPAMAKGVEDTAFYRYNRLISLNEVGGTPEIFGRGVDEFHESMGRWAAAWPDSMLTLSTHDTKRSGDVRARINLISELPDGWRATVDRFAEVNDRHRRGPWPDRNAEYLMYQTLLGAWPIGVDRMTEFMRKATREAKVHTSWVDPSEEYDDAVAAFVAAALSDRTFISELQRLLSTHRVAERGRLNSLAQTTILLTCPGVADLYQGSELWDLSLVDPDNRRPVDYPERQRLMDHLPDRPPNLRLAQDEKGVWKLWLISRLVARRRALCPDQMPRYEPLEVDGPGAAHTLAFVSGETAVVVPRLVCGIGEDREAATVAVGSQGWTNCLTGTWVPGGRARVSELLDGCPVGVLVRGSG